MAFERITTTRWRLDKDSQSLLGAILIYIRQECDAASTAVGIDSPENKIGVITGSAGNYKKQVEAIDRILSRINGAFDIQKLNAAMQILSHALSFKDARYLSKRAIESGVRKYGVVASNIGRSRIQNERSNQLASETGTEPDGPIDSDRGGGPFDTYNVDE